MAAEAVAEVDWWGGNQALEKAVEEAYTTGLAAPTNTWPAWKHLQEVPGGGEKSAFNGHGEKDYRGRPDLSSFNIFNQSIIKKSKTGKNA